MANKKLYKKISTNLPFDLLEEACSITTLNQTDTLIKALQELIAIESRKKAVALRGKVKIDLDLDKVRQRKHI